MDDPGGGDTAAAIDAAASDSCSICLDLVIDDGSRSIAKLQCGHEFHLDCIGSAFNSKGAMQCPNCRKVERGRWLYASGATFSFPEFSIDDWTPDEDPFEISYSEMPSRVQWCPFSGLLRVHSSFEEVEFPSTTYHNLQRHQSLFADQQTAASSVPHSYVAYFGPVPPTTSTTNESVEDPNFNHRRNGLSGPNEILTAHTFPVIDIRHQIRGHHSHPFSDQISIPPATQRSTRGEHDGLTRSGSVVHPFLYGHGSVPRGNNARSHQRIPASHAVHHQQNPSNPPSVPSPVIHGLRRFHVPRGLPPATSQSDHSGGFFLSHPGSSGRNLHETENSLPNHPGRASFHHWHRH